MLRLLITAFFALATTTAQADSTATAPSEIKFKNEHSYPHINDANEFCCGGFAAGNFLGNNQELILNIKSPDDYVQALWGSPNPNYSIIYQKFKNERWKDQINLLRNKNGHLSRLHVKLDLENGFCLHASKLVEADFNEDGILDILVACHGFDGPPYPGDHSYILFGGSGGIIKSYQLTKKRGFYHGATVLDVNNDGHLDPVLTDANSGKIVAFLNDGNGDFGSAKTILSGLKANYTISSFDFNKDGFADLIAGGHEDDINGSLITKIYFNDGRGRFSSSRAARIPKVVKFGIVLDYLVYGKWLFVVRTMSQPKPYVGGAIQQIDLDSMTQVGLISKDSQRHVANLRRVKNNSGIMTFGSPIAFRNMYDFTVDQNGNMRFVR
jgi:hypothetical protein